MKSKKDIFRFLLKVTLRTVCFMSIIKLSSFFKLSFIFGSKFAAFSGTSATVPLAGACAGGLVSLIIFSLSFFLRYALFGVASLHILAFYLPGLCAALYFSSKNIFFKVMLRLLLPIVCILLFLLHPVGIQAFAYSLFWLIPIVIYFKKQKNIFLDALASTFIAHAVGSVIFLYTVQLDSLAWHSLMPMVLLERLAIASAIYIFYKVINYARENFLYFLTFRSFGYTLGAKFYAK